MSNDNNESNEAYERRMEIRELMDAPRGTKFQFKDKGTESEVFGWHDISGDPQFDFIHNNYRIAPHPKKVLRPAWEILRLCVEQDILKISGEEDGVLEIELPESCFNFSDIVYWSRKGEVPQWAERDKWPVDWFTLKEPQGD